jgi:anaphase-promoting complex subunit 10
MASNEMKMEMDEGNKEHKETGARREIGGDAVWTLSTAKPGNGIEQLRDNSLETYWQSDGPQPHTISIQFHKKVNVNSVAVHLDYKLDESYTPKTISIKSGTTFHDLKEIWSIELDEPSGWIECPLKRQIGGSFIRTFFLQICFNSMHQNGRDTHVRQVKVYGPRRPELVQLAESESLFLSVR